MADESFLLVSLDEDKSKSLAQVLSNDTSRKILDYLSKKGQATETEVSTEMKVPLSTVHYNLDLLVKADLVTDENFTYSEKGKQIIHYALSNKYVIIAPKKSEALKEKLKQFLPVIIITSIVSFGIKYLYNPMNVFSAAPRLMAEASGQAEKVALASYDTSVNLVSQSQDFAVWFLFGSVFALIIYFIWAELIFKKIKKR